MLVGWRGEQEFVYKIKRGTRRDELGQIVGHSVLRTG